MKLMDKRQVVVGVAVAVALAGMTFAARWSEKIDGANAKAEANAQARQVQRRVPVEVATVVRKQSPVRLDALGTVTPIASVAIRSRIDNEIVGIHFADGAIVKQGDLLVTLDQRALEAQVRQAEGNIAKDLAQLEGAERDIRRYTDLVAKNATPVVNLDNAKTQADTFRAAMRADQAALENLKVQLSYCMIRAPISGRISQANVKVGNIVRTADITPIAVIHQIAPVYVSFTAPQRHLPDVRRALAAQTATVEVIIPGEMRRARGQVTMIENAVDAATGMATIRATMPNTDELLWPGTLVTAELTLRTEEAVLVSSNAVQVSQSGKFVFVVKDGVAKVQPVEIERQVGTESVVSSGLNGGETVVTDGQLLLSDGTPIDPRGAKAAGDRAKAADG